MNRSEDRWFAFLGGLILTVIMVCLVPGEGLAQKAVIRKIEIQSNPQSVKIFVSRSVPVKVIQVEKNEILVALKDIELNKGYTVQGKADSLIRQVAVENLENNVVAAILTGRRTYDRFESKFNTSDSSLEIRFKDKAAVAAPKPAPKPEPVVEMSEKQPAPADASPMGTPEPEKADVLEPVPGPAKSPEPTPPVNAEEKRPAKPVEKKVPEAKATQPAASKYVKNPTPAVYVPPRREKGQFKGDISDITRIIDGSECDSKKVGNAIILLKKELYKEALDVLDQYILEENFTCLELAYYLKAYAFYQTADKADFTQLIKAERLFQDALVAYPKSAYVPFGYAAIGMVQMKLNNHSAAEGYFNIIKQGYATYPGIPEVIYYLAEIYDKKGFEDKALRYYQQVFEDTTENSYIPDAGIGYGEALYKKRQYLDALTVLNFVVESDARKVYASPELLLYIGNAYFEVGQGKPARVNLTRVLNLFQNIEGRDVILSKIGDTYGMENKPDKAIKVYDLVREKYPDTEGYIASSIGIARYLKSDQEKIEIYQMIKTKFPEDKYARISMMRLAEIYQANKEYDKCIKEIEDLLSTHPRGLRYEAVKLMQKAYEALFQKQLKSDEYTKVLNRYEMEHTRIDRMGSRQIEFSVGLAYLQAKLYEESFNHLITAYKQYKRSSRSPELLFGLGVAMDESGRDDDALKLFLSFAKRFPKDGNRAEALTRAGDIYLAKDNYAKSSESFSEAVKAARGPLAKGRILMHHSKVFEKKGDMKTAARLGENAIKELALASGDNYDILTAAYRELGQRYTTLHLYVKAADAYLKALSFSDSEREKANLGFLLGDAYQKGNIIPKAKEAFQDVVSSYDSVWARLAQQRLNTLELAETVQNS